MNKKSQINQVFVYLVSIIIILFAGFLVTKFVITFSSDTQELSDFKFYSQLEKDYLTVFSTFGAEKQVSYRVSNDISNVCFSQDLACIDSLSDINDNFKDSFKSIFNSGDNIAIFTNDDILNSIKFKEYYIESPGCFCIKPKNNIIDLVIENRKNKVYIFELN